jgi:hypothetical protein
MASARQKSKIGFKEEMLSKQSQPFLTIMPLSASNKRASV